MLAICYATNKLEFIRVYLVLAFVTLCVLVSYSFFSHLIYLSSKCSRLLGTLSRSNDCTTSYTAYICDCSTPLVQAPSDGA